MTIPIKINPLLYQLSVKTILNTIGLILIFRLHGEIMRKNDLINLLENIEGNPEIKLWNGFVQDWQDIDKTPVPITIFKHSLDSHINTARMSGYAYRKEPRELSPQDVEELKKSYKNINYEINSFVTEEDVKLGRYKKKKIILLQPKIKGQASFDRLGEVNY